MDDYAAMLVVAMPTDEGLREQLAQLHPEGLKPIIYTGAVKRPCTACGMELYVGPRQQAALAEVSSTVLLCVWCARKRVADMDATAVVKHLGNPEDNRG